LQADVRLPDLREEIAQCEAQTGRLGVSANNSTVFLGGSNGYGIEAIYNYATNHQVSESGSHGCLEGRSNA